MTGEEETATSPEAGDSHWAGLSSPGTSSAGAAGPPGTASPAAGAADAGEANARGRSFWRELPVLIVVALVIALLIKTFVVQAFYIPSGSMQNTLEIGDKVLVNKLAYHFRPIHPGDIIVFDGAGSWDAPAVSRTSGDPVVRLFDVTLRPLLHSIGGLFGTAPGQTDYIKRVIGVPGDHVACCNARGLLTVNGVALQEQGYLYPGNAPGESPIGESGHFSLTVPAGRLWVLGDHRAISDDSRGHVFDPGDGTIPENEVIGRASLIVWPPGRWRDLGTPATFRQPGILGAASASSLSAGLTSPAGVAARSAGTLAAASPYLPAAAGLAGAVPVTILGRRLRLRSRRPGPGPRRRSGLGMRWRSRPGSR